MRAFGTFENLENRSYGGQKAAGNSWFQLRCSGSALIISHGGATLRGPVRQWSSHASFCRDLNSSVKPRPFILPAYAFAIPVRAAPILLYLQQDLGGDPPRMNANERELGIERTDRTGWN